MLDSSKDSTRMWLNSFPNIVSYSFVPTLSASYSFQNRIRSWVYCNESTSRILGSRFFSVFRRAIRPTIGRSQCHHLLLQCNVRLRFWIKTLPNLCFLRSDWPSSAHLCATFICKLISNEPCLSPIPSSFRAAILFKMLSNFQFCSVQTDSSRRPFQKRIQPQKNGTMLRKTSRARGDQSTATQRRTPHTVPCSLKARLLNRFE